MKNPPVFCKQWTGCLSLFPALPKGGFFLLLSFSQYRISALPIAYQVGDVSAYYVGINKVSFIKLTILLRQFTG